VKSLENLLTGKDGLYFSTENNEGARGALAEGRALKDFIIKPFNINRFSVLRVFAKLALNGTQLTGLNKKPCNTKRSA
jgi:hypothetical protein